MQRRFLIPVLLWAAVLLPPEGLEAQTKAPPKPAAGGSKQPSQAPAAGTAPKRAAPARSQPRRTATRRRPARRPAVDRGQLRPSRERYAQIQTALMEAGYFSDPANGDWGPSSVDALMRFQRDNGLEPTGKIDSKSLIQLGLGPKYDTQAQAQGPGAGSPQ